MKKAIVKYTFPDGSVMRMPLSEHERQLLRQAVQMEGSDSPELRVAGARLVQEIAKRLSHQVVTDATLHEKTEKARHAGSKGGSSRAEPSWWDAVEKGARELLKAGRSERELVALLVKRTGRLDGAIRNCLKKRGIIKARK